MDDLKKLLPEIDFGKYPDQLVPAIIQDVQTSRVLMLGFMSKEAIEKTFESGHVTFYSRTKDRLWTKGETSGNYLNFRSVRLDCDKDTLLIQALPEGPVCHTGAETCFDEENEDSNFLNELAAIIRDRRDNPEEGSYTTSLFAKGINKIAQKVGEEAVELVIEAKDSNNDLFKNEAADLIFHYLVLLTAKGITLEDVIDVLKKRHVTQ